MLLNMLERQSRPGQAVGWDEVVVGYDFALVGPSDIQAWARTRAWEGPACRRLADLEGAGLERFEAALWAAATEATGKAPRPGGQRWARAQDRWRVALLMDALAAPLTPEALAVAVERIYDQVGCPEDMLDLWHRHSPWENKPGRADHRKVEAFVLQRAEEGPRSVA